MKKFHLKGVLKDLPMRVPCVAVTCMATPCIAIPCMGYSKLHEMCIFHVTRKLGLCQHVMGMHSTFLMTLHVEMSVKLKF